jgi:hypothetical protein
MDLKVSFSAKYQPPKMIDPSRRKVNVGLGGASSGQRHCGGRRNLRSDRQKYGGAARMEKRDYPKPAAGLGLSLFIF